MIETRIPPYRDERFTRAFKIQNQLDIRGKMVTLGTHRRGQVKKENY